MAAVVARPAAERKRFGAPRVPRAHFVGRGPQRYSGGIGGNDRAAICQNEKLFLQRGDENRDSYGPRSHAAR